MKIVHATQQALRQKVLAYRRPGTGKMTFDGS
jgi:hypothetical protein